MGKYRLSHIYCSPEKIKIEFLEQQKEDSWIEEEDRDDVVIWEQQKKEYLEVNPTHARMIEELEANTDTIFADEGMVDGI